MRILCDRIINPNNIVLNNTPFSIMEDKVFVGGNNSSGENIVIKDSIVFPGLINIHDHLKYSWYERVGKGKEIKEGQSHYDNVYQWLADLYKVFDHVFNNTDNGHTDNGLEIMFQLGLYKQIFSATTTVLNHSRYPRNILEPKNQYINIVEDMEGELVVQPDLISNETSHPMRFGRSIQDAHNKAINSIPQRPFMIHSSEGNSKRDKETKKEISILNNLGVLTPQSILVHCINADINDIKLIAKNKCSVVWCPYTSNFVLGEIADINAMLSHGINICIGTDSSCSGSENLLAELNYAKEFYQTRFHEDISSSELFNMVTSNPAKALMQENKIGKIADGFNADIAIVDRKSDNYYDDILSSKPENIIALWSDGNFIYGDESFFRQISEKAKTTYTRFSIDGRKKVVIGDPRSLFESFIKTFNIQEPISFDFIPKELQSI